MLSIPPTLYLRTLADQLPKSLFWFESKERGPPPSVSTLFGFKKKQDLKMRRELYSNDRRRVQIRLSSCPAVPPPLPLAQIFLCCSKICMWYLTPYTIWRAVGTPRKACFGVTMTRVLVVSFTTMPESPTRASCTLRDTGSQDGEMIFWSTTRVKILMILKI